MRRHSVHGLEYTVKGTKWLKSRKPAYGGEGFVWGAYKRWGIFRTYKPEIIAQIYIEFLSKNFWNIAFAYIKLL